MPNSESVESSDEARRLPLSGLALAQARRVVGELAAKASSPESFRDAVPYALDRLDNVWRTINTESRGSRPRAFADWWASENSHHNRVAVRRLRNLELKDNLLTTQATVDYQATNLIVVREDGKIGARRPDASMAPLLPDGSVDAGAGTAGPPVWRFTLQGIDDRPAQEILDTLLQDLEARVLPTAERLLQE